VEEHTTLSASNPDGAGWALTAVPLLQKKKNPAEISPAGFFRIRRSGTQRA